VALGIWVSALCVLFAVPIAWGISRTDTPLKNLVRSMVLGAFVTPDYLGAVGWAAYAMPLLFITIALFWCQQRLIGRKGFVSLTGRGGERRLLPLGGFRWVLFGFASLVVAFAIVLPYLALAQAAFAKAWGRGFSLDNLTLNNFKYILFDYQMASQSIVHSITYAGAAASLALALALLVAYAMVRRLLPLARVLSFVCLAPFVIPGIVLAIGFYAAYTAPPLQLYDTAWILILAFTTRFLPIAYASSEAAIRSLNPEMEDAVRILGGSRLIALRRVVAPLLKSGLIGAWLLVFIPATRELSSAIFHYGPNTQTMSIVLFYMNDEGPGIIGMPSHVACCCRSIRGARWRHE
jgi:iron(III) transport system permease protein